MSDDSDIERAEKDRADIQRWVEPAFDFDAAIAAAVAANPKTGACGKCGADAFRGMSECPDCADVTRARANARRTAAAIASATMPEGFSFTRRGFDDPLVRDRVRDSAALTKAKANALGTEWMTLRGVAGLGKSVLAATTAWRTTEEGVAPVWASAVRMASAVQRCRLGEEPQEVRSAIEAKLLVLDDLGSEPVIATSPIVEIIHARHEAGRRTITTTWLDNAGIKARYGDGIARRLLERATVIDLKAGGK